MELATEQLKEKIQLGILVSLTFLAKDMALISTTNVYS